MWRKHVIALERFAAEKGSGIVARDGWLMIRMPARCAGSVDLLDRAGALRAVLACAMEAQDGYEDGLASDERDTPNRMRSPPLSAAQPLQASLPTTRVGESRIREGSGAHQRM